MQLLSYPVLSTYNKQFYNMLHTINLNRVPFKQLKDHIALQKRIYDKNPKINTFKINIIV